jgi:hypothetical protein
LARDIAHIRTVRNLFEILFGDLGIYEKIILKLIFKIQDAIL